ncbi:MAG: hypothetical protein KF902_11935 [Phycisphaeraceae bacterium]|nr:hypothetical protein [Phycisphaeraceae bacterium]
MSKPQKKAKKNVRAIPKEKAAGPGSTDASKAADALHNRGPRDHATDKSLNRGIGGPSAKAPRRAH